MEVLNNVQLEGRRINVEISKMMVAEDVITNGRSSGGGGFGGGRVLLQEEKVCTKREGSAVVEATETQVQEGGLVEEALLQEKEVLAEVQLRGEGSSDRAQDVLKVLVTHLDQEDQEETNILLIFL
jgi:ATP-dependent RNA helicase DeaD